MQGKTIEKYAAILGRAGILTAAMLASGCAQILGIEDLPPLPVDAAVSDAGPGSFTVRGSATGVLGPVVLGLLIDGDSEQLTVAQEGTFSFATQLEAGASYAVVLVNPDVPCTLRNETGVIASADTGIELTCTGASLASVFLSDVAPAVTLVQGTTDYVVDLPLLQQSVALTATVAMPGDTVTIAGTPVASGAQSATLTLSLGDNPVDIVVENALGWQRTYRLTLRRAAQVAQFAYGKASNASASGYFGISVALSGDTLAVGAWGEASAGGDQDDDSAPNSGAVYVFRRSGIDWTQEAYLKACNTEAQDQFGISVALSGDTLAVGAWLEDGAAQGVNCEQATNEKQDSGAVYVFRRTGTVWEKEDYLKARYPGGSDLFGNSVALSGDTLAVSAYLEDSVATGVNGNNEDDDSRPDSGAVYVFRRSGTAWQQEAYLKASNPDAGDYFGNSVALLGDTLAVGAYLEGSGVEGDQNDNSAPQSGAVYMFRRSGTVWQQDDYLKASNIGAGDVFGWSVALSGDTLAVGACWDDNTATDSGAVYVFRRSGTTWLQEGYLKASNIGVDDAFGASVALSGDTLAVGAHLENSKATGVNDNQADDSTTDSGAVYMFRRTGMAWQQQAYIKASNTGVSDEFSRALALSGDTLAVGAWLEDSAAQGVGGNQDGNGAENSGAVYIFH